MSSIKVYEVSGDIRPLNAISVWDASSSGTRPMNSIPVWKDTNNGDRPLNSIQVKIVDKALNAIPVWFNGGSEPGPDLPPYTLRLKYKEGVTPTFSKGTGTLVDSTNNIWDLTYNNTDWTGILSEHTDLLEVLGVNTSNVSNMKNMFYNCTSLTTVPLFDTSNITDMWGMFYNCTSLTTVPLFDTSNVLYMFMMFYNCYNVQSGALALYQQASTQTTPPISYGGCFNNCGRDTQTGAAELAQIPTSWGGTGT